MFNEPRNWKWMLPGSFFVAFTLASLSLYADPKDELTYQVSLFGFGIAAILLLATLVNLALYVGRHAADILYTRRNALSLSADARILENIKGVHPETLRLVFGERQRAWMLKAGIDLPEGIHTYSVLYARPDVTEMFFIYFLQNSKDYRVMPKRMLSDKSYRFDPLRKATDYEQYDQLVSLLQARGVITQEYDANRTALWIAPWTPKLLAEDFGWELEEGENG